VQEMTTYHRRRVAAEMEDPEFRIEYERTRRELAQVNAVIRALDELRDEAGWSKAELARQIGKNDASVRRLFTAEVNPELRTVAAMAAALGAEIRIVSRRRARRESRRPAAVA
jgi:ribosome-binding protein aMBF1 (putative translation factor)